MFLERSGVVPLVVGGSGLQDAIPVMTTFYAAEAHRLGELYLSGTQLSDMDFLINALSASLPHLEALSLDCYLVSFSWEGRSDRLPLSRDNCPRLRRLFLKDAPFLPETGFPLLTHLALETLSIPDERRKVAEFLAQCPRLESVALNELSEEAPHWSDITPLPLEHLQRVTFHDMNSEVLKYYGALLQPRKKDSAQHILGYRAEDTSFPLQFLLPSEEAENTDVVGIALHPDRSGRSVGYDVAFALTVTTNESTRRLAAYFGRLRNGGRRPNDWIIRILSARDAPLDTREVWLVNLGISYPWPREPSTPTPVPSPLTLFSSVETVHVVVDHSFLLGEKPSLHLLPSLHHPSFTAHRLTTLHLAHGYSDYERAVARAAESLANLTNTLDFSLMFKDLEGGAYGYLRHLVLQTTGHLRVDESDLDRLREYFETVCVEKVARLPEMPLRGEDPAREGCRQWPGSLW